MDDVLRNDKDNLTDDEIKTIMSEKYLWTKANEQKNMWLNCNKCMQELPKGVSPQMYCKTQLSTYIPDAMPTTRVLVLWCIRHKEQVWDSRHLKNAF